MQKWGVNAHLRRLVAGSVADLEGCFARLAGVRGAGTSTCVSGGNTLVGVVSVSSSSASSSSATSGTCTPSCFRWRAHTWLSAVQKTHFHRSWCYCCMMCTCEAAFSQTFWHLLCLNLCIPRRISQSHRTVCHADSSTITQNHPVSQYLCRLLFLCWTASALCLGGLWSLLCCLIFRLFLLGLCRRLLLALAAALLGWAPALAWGCCARLGQRRSHSLCSTCQTHQYHNKVLIYHGSNGEDCALEIKEHIELIASMCCNLGEESGNAATERWKLPGAGGSPAASGDTAAMEGSALVGRSAGFAASVSACIHHRLLELCCTWQYLCWPHHAVTSKCFATDLDSLTSNNKVALTRGHDRPLDFLDFAGGRPRRFFCDGSSCASSAGSSAAASSSGALGPSDSIDSCTIPAGSSSVSSAPARSVPVSLAVPFQQGHR